MPNLKHLFNFKRLSIIGLALFFVLGGLSCGTPSNLKVGSPKQITLNYWTVYNDESSYKDVISSFRALYPQVIVNIRKFRPEDYDNELLNAFAEDRGPDIFSVPNTAVNKYLTKIVPMPVQTTMNVAVTQGMLKKQTYTSSVILPSFKQRYLETTFIPQVLTDAQIGTKLYGLPLSMDTLVLYYNNALLAAANIPAPATNYEELQQHIQKTTKQDALGNIVQSGVAMGTANNIPRFADILSLLMMQNGTDMVTDNGDAVFDKLPPALSGRATLPGIDALLFYLDFASPTKQVYTWNEKQPDALEAFEAGKLTYFFGYQYQLPIIRAQAPKLDFGIAKMPQIKGNTEVNFASYWLEVVSKKSKNTDAAWTFLQFITKPEQVKNFLSLAKKPTAVKSLIASQLEDVDLGVFAEQLLTAKSWYRGTKPELVDTVFAQLIQEVPTMTATDKIRSALSNTASKINQTINQ